MKKLTLISGKGGVGKTTISLALALRAAQQGKKVLIAECQSEEQIAHLLGHSPIGHAETLLMPRLYGINIHPKESFREYVLLQLKSKLLYEAVFENRFVRNFIEATPGLADLMIIGKIYSLLQEYDGVIVDSPATGHGLALLQIPAIVAGAVRVGPLKTHAAAIHERLQDPSDTGVILVTTPEELPVTETLEMAKHLQEHLFPLDQVILNQSVSPPLSVKERATLDKLVRSSQGPFFTAMQIEGCRAERSAIYLKKLSTLSLPISEIPYLYSSSFGFEEVQTVASHLG